MEKKLTNEEVVKALECCINDKCSEECPYRGKRYDCVYQHRHEKDLLDLINRQKAEIERMTEENEYLDGCAKQFLADYQKCEIERAELQKQVSELKENQVIECHGMLKGCDMVKQAVKDTAKEICLKIIKGQPQPIKEKWVEWFKKEYDVEVE